VLPQDYSNNNINNNNSNNDAQYGPLRALLRARDAVFLYVDPTYY